MNLYLNFHLAVKEKFQQQIQLKGNDFVRSVYLNKFLDKLIYHLSSRFPTKKKLISKVVNNLFEEEDSFLIDFYYYFKIIADDFEIAIQHIDFDQINDTKAAYTLSQKLRQVSQNLKKELKGI